MELDKVAPEQPAKKVWVKPTLESLSIDKTEYWGFEWNGDENTGFWKNVWVNES